MNQRQNVVYLSPNSAVNETSNTNLIEQPVQKSLGTSLKAHLAELAALIANVTESYTTSIFLADNKNQTLELYVAHSLSRELIPQAKIKFGSGLIGWTAENCLRVSVCPFEHDATTLLYYSEDQGLKSFIAVPIIGKKNSLLGVIACDSKKSYAFAKITEKILQDLAQQAANIIELHQELSFSEKNKTVDQSLLAEALENLRNTKTEKDLLKSACNIPQTLVERDALVIITLIENSGGQGTFYSDSPESHIEHKLLETVCKHRKVLCSERSVQARPTSDPDKRSFLSVPFHVNEREVGSLNLLSKPDKAFTPNTIEALEQIAKVISKELEFYRLRAKASSSLEAAGLIPWDSFTVKAQEVIENAKRAKKPLTLLRFAFQNSNELEGIFGASARVAIIQKLMRLISQVSGANSLCSYLYGCHIVALVDAAEVKAITNRFRGLVSKIDSTPELAANGWGISDLVMSGLQVTTAVFPRDGQKIEDLIKYTFKELHSSQSVNAVESNVAYASNWK